MPLSGPGLALLVPVATCLCRAVLLVPLRALCEWAAARAVAVLRAAWPLWLALRRVLCLTVLVSLSARVTWEASAPAASCPWPAVLVPWVARCSSAAAPAPRELAVP